MALKFNDILNEQDSSRSDKYINKLLPIMKEWFANRYDDTHWIDSANTIMEYRSPQEHEAQIEKSKEIHGELQSLLTKMGSPEKYTPKQFNDLFEKYHEVANGYQKEVQGIRHLFQLFSDTFTGDEVSFVEKYVVPIGTLLKLWKRFREEIYLPGKIEYNKSRGDHDIEYGIEDKEYQKIGLYNGFWGHDSYLVLKDTTTNDYILGIQMIGDDWDNMDYSKLYHKRFNTTNDVKQFIAQRDKGYLLTDLGGSEVEISEIDLTRLSNYLFKIYGDLIEYANEEYDGDMSQALSDKIEDWWYENKGAPGISNGAASSIAHHWEKYEDIISHLSF